MSFIKNYNELAKSEERRLILDLIEEAFSSIQPEKVFQNNISRRQNSLKIQDKTFDLSQFGRVFVVGFGKGSAGIAQLLENLLEDKIIEGHVIDTVQKDLKKIQFTHGTHPLPSDENYKFTKIVIDAFSMLTEKDLMLVIICGGGSAMLVQPHTLSLEQKIAVNKALIKSGANITEMNIVRKHLSKVKGGGLAKLFYPATVVSLIFSDVPGNDLSTIASGATVKDPTTVDQAWDIIHKYNLAQELNSTKENFVETPKDDKYFEKVSNILILSNLTALNAMKKKAEELGKTVTINSDSFQSDANEAGKILIEKCPQDQIMLTGGETTVHVTGEGHGGRNQQLVLASLNQLDENTIIASFDSDGWDFETLAGAIGDHLTKQKAQELGLNIEEYLKNNDSLAFFQKVGDGIDTGRLPSNVSDLMIVYKKS